MDFLKGKYTSFNEVHENWTNVKNKCRTTVNKEYTSKEPTDELKHNLLLAEHSPIRLLTYDWSWKSIPYWVSTELSRHKNEKFISSQRTDRTGIERDGLRQDAPVNFDGVANAQNIIDISRKRLCYCATKEARTLMEDLKSTLIKNNFLIGYYAVPNCVYRGGCPEFKPCGFYKNFCEKYKNIYDFNDLKQRYKAYNEYFLNQHSQINHNGGD